MTSSFCICFWMLHEAPKRHAPPFEARRGGPGAVGRRPDLRGGAMLDLLGPWLRGGVHKKAKDAIRGSWPYYEQERY